MSGRLEGKTAVITGAGAGIARASALLFAQEGATVVVAELDRAAGEETVKLVTAAGGSAYFVEMNVLEEESVKSAFASAREQVGTIDILFNCIGGTYDGEGPMMTVSLDLLNRTMALNLNSVFLCSKEVLPGMIEAGHGTIVNVSTYLAAIGGPTLHAYTAAKAAVASITRSMAAAYSTAGVRVNAIAPGAVLTESVRNRDFDPAPIREKYPFGVGEPDDLARVALFLASDESTMLNAATLAADGGWSVY